MEQADLIERARAGDRLAMNRLYQAHAPHVFAVVRRLVGDEHLAQDVSQEVWIRAFRKLDQFRGDSGFGTWVHRVARNAALSWIRSDGRREEVETEARATGSLPPLPDDAAINRRMLERALDRLPSGYREVLILHDVEGMTHREIAESLGVAEGTSKSQLHKARARMRELLAPVGNGEDLEKEAGRDG